MTVKSNLKCKTCGGYEFKVVQNRSYGDPGGPRFEYTYEFECIHCGTKTTTWYMDEMELAEWEEIE